MDEANKSELDRILRKFQDKADEESRKIDETIREDARYQREFPIVIKNVIKPVMEEIGTIIKKQGHNYNIRESNWFIFMNIIPKSMYQYAPNQPSIHFTRVSASICMFKKPSPRSTRGETNLKIEDIDKKFVEKNILDIMKICERKVFIDQDL
jgi:hypothetical protein